MLFGQHIVHLYLKPGVKAEHALAALHLQRAGQNVRAPDERCHKQVGGPLVDSLRRAHLLDVALIHDGNAVRHGHGLLLVVGNIHVGDAHRVLYLFYHRAHLHTKLCVQVAQRFVHQKHIGLYDKRAGQRHTLLLPAGKPVGHAVCIFLNMHQLHKLVGFGLNGLFRFLSVFQAKGHVVPHCHVGEDGIVLKHHTDVAAGRVYIVDALVIEVEIAPFNAVEACNHSQKRRLSTPRWTKEGEKLTLLDIQRQI